MTPPIRQTIMSRIVKHPEIRRQEIVATARQLFLTKTYDDTSMQDVMGQLNIAKGTIYHYFTSKEELLDAVIDAIVEEDLVRKRTIIAETPGSALDRMIALITSANPLEFNKPALGLVHRPANLGMHARLLAVAFAKQAPLYADLIRQGCEQGLFQTGYPLECAEFILASVLFLTDEMHFPWMPADLERRARAFPALIEAQLKAPAGAFAFMATHVFQPGKVVEEF